METPTLTQNGASDAAASESPAWAYAPFRTAAVLGAGVMGSQIAAHLANAGLEVLLLDVTPESIGREGEKNSLVEGAFKAATKMKPDPFMSAEAQKRITLGNFDDDFDKIGDADWIIEVVVERMDVKQEVMERIEKTASDTAVISTNTSGLPIAQIAEGRSDGFRRRFLGTHFFNPPRYLKLFEVIPTEDTDPEVVDRVSAFARVHLGKGIVVAKDTPNFIGNRIGTYAMLGAVEQFESGGFSIEEIDALTGTLIGHAKSATFRTADVVGLDTLRHVTANLYEAVPEDESRERFQVPDVLQRLVDLKQLGAKSKAGFYKKEGKTIRSFNPETGAYEDPKELGFDVGDFKGGQLADRLRKLWEDSGRAGQFFRTTTLDLIGYTARRTPEISDSPANVDRALQWGFGWEMGPYQVWDALGIDAVRQALADEGIEVPEWVASVPAEGFYRDTEAGTPQVWTPGTGDYEDDPRPADEWGLTYLKEDANNTLWQNDEAALIDVGEGVALFEFRSKSNSLGQEVISGLVEAIGKVGKRPRRAGHDRRQRGEQLLRRRQPRRGRDGARDGRGLGPGAVYRGVPGRRVQGPLRPEAGRRRDAPARPRRRVRDDDGVPAPGLGVRNVHGPRRARRRADPGRRRDDHDDGPGRRAGDGRGVPERSPAVAPEALRADRDGEGGRERAPGP